MNILGHYVYPSAASSQGKHFGTPPMRWPKRGYISLLEDSRTNHCNSGGKRETEDRWPFLRFSFPYTKISRLKRKPKTVECCFKQIWKHRNVFKVNAICSRIVFFWHSSNVGSSSRLKWQISFSFYIYTMNIVFTIICRVWLFSTVHFKGALILLLMLSWHVLLFY